MIVTKMTNQALCGTRATNTGIPNTGIGGTTEYRYTAVNLAGINTGIVLFNTVVFSFEKATVPTTQSVTIYLSRVGAAAAVQRTSLIPCVQRCVICKPVTVQTASHLSAPCCCSLQISWQ